MGGGAEGQRYFEGLVLLEKGLCVGIALPPLAAALALGTRD